LREIAAAMVTGAKHLPHKARRHTRVRIEGVQVLGIGYLDVIRRRSSQLLVIRDPVYRV
jgi:hypothetical protein